MKNRLQNLKVLPLFLCILIFQFFTANAQQTLTQINGWNAYVHLPANYNSTSKSYPTIIFFPGLGEIGTVASKVIASGPGAYIAQGWDGNVQVDGSTVEFIVISLQSPTAYPNEFSMNDKIQKIKSLYRVDNNKLYLTGLSHGGWCSSTFVTGDPLGGPFTYANQIAAVVTVQGVIPDDNSPFPNLFDNYASVGGKLLSFEQRLDGRAGQYVVNRMNAYKPNSAYFIETNFGSGGHCCWNEFYGGQGKQPGVFNIAGVNQNLYQWLARQQLGGSITPPPTNQAPTANAGADKTLTLPTNTVSLTGSGADADGTISTYSWTKLNGPAGGIIGRANAAATTITALQQGVYTFRLQVTDNKGATALDDVTVTVNVAAGNGGGTACNTAAPVKHYLAYTSAPGEIYRPNGSAWKGGDTVVITGTNYSVIEFNNIQGDACRPIVIMPQTKVVTGVFRINNNSKYLKIWGGNNPYGFKVQNSSFALSMCSNIEINNVEITGGSVGVYCKQDPYYADPSTWGSSGYVMRDFKFTNLYIHDVGGEGFYIGSTTPSGYAVKKPNGQDTSIIPIRLENVEVSNSVIQRTGWDGIQISNARGGNKVFNNTIWNYGMTNTDGQEAGIIIGGNTNADVYNNKITKGVGSGVQIFGYGVIKVYNNYFDSTGVDGTALGLQTIYANDYITQPEQNEKQTMFVYGNFIKNPMKKGAIFITNYQGNSMPSKVYDNKLCMVNPPANWASLYLFLYVPGTDNTNNILSCDASGTTQPVEPPATNLPPLVVIENDKAITLPLNMTGLSMIEATDADGTIVSYLWTKLSGPAGGNIIAPADARTAALNLIAGEYRYVLMVTDNQGAKASDTLQITVNAEPANKIIKVNLYAGLAGVPDNSWNNWRFDYTDNTGYLNYEDGRLSGISAALSGDRRIVDNGVNYASSATTVNPAVLRHNSAATSQRALTLTGLKPGKIYDFEFFASRSNSKNATVFALQNRKDTIMTDNNINDVARFTNVVVDASGKLVINLSRIGVWNYLAGFIIYEKENDLPLKSSPVVPENNVQYGEDIVEATDNKVSVFPNPFVNDFKVQIDNKEQADFAIILNDISGKRAFYKEVTKSNTRLLVNVPVANLPGGVYILQIINKKTGKKTVHKVIKN